MNRHSRARIHPLLAVLALLLSGAGLAVGASPAWAQGQSRVLTLQCVDLAIRAGKETPLDLLLGPEQISTKVEEVQLTSKVPWLRGQYERFFVLPLRSRLMRWAKHPFAYVSVEDSTIAKSLGLIKQAFGELKVDTKDPAVKAEAAKAEKEAADAAKKAGPPKAKDSTEVVEETPADVAEETPTDAEPATPVDVAAAQTLADDIALTVDDAEPAGDYNPAVEFVAEVDDQIAYVERYQKDVHDLEIDTINLALERDVIRKHLAYRYRGKNPITGRTEWIRRKLVGKYRGWVVKAVDDGAGGVRYEGDGKTSGHELNYGDRGQMEGRLDEINRELRRRRGGDLFTKNEFRDRLVAQAVGLRKLENTYYMILSVMNSRSIKRETLPPLLQQMLAKIEKLHRPTEYVTVTEKDGTTYQKAKPPEFRREFSPPLWAWQKMHRIELTSELRAFFRKATPMVRKGMRKIVDSRVIKMIQEFSPEERKLYRLDKISDNFNWWYGTRKGTSITAIVMGAGGVYETGILGLVRSGFTWFFADKLDMGKCTLLHEQEEYGPCVEKYLTDLAKQHHKVLDGRDKYVQDAVAELDRQHAAEMQRFYASEAEKSEAQALRDENDRLSESYRQRTIMEPLDFEEFKTRLVGPAGAGGDSAFLEFRYKQQFDRNRDLVLQILALPPDSKERNRLFRLLKARTPGEHGLGEGLEALIREFEAREDEETAPDETTVDETPPPDETPRVDQTPTVEETPAVEETPTVEEKRGPKRKKKTDGAPET